MATKLTDPDAGQEPTHEYEAPPLPQPPTGLTDAQQAALYYARKRRRQAQG